MKITYLCQWLISLLFIGAFSGCTDHRVPAVTPGAGSNRLRVKTITQETPNNPTKVSAFRYDGQNRLSLIIAYQTPDSSVAPVENTTYQYDGQNRLTQVQHTTVRRGSNSETYEYLYNGAGRVSQLRYALSTYSVSPSYTPDNRASGFIRAFDLGGLSYSGSGTFAFTGNNLTLATDRARLIRLGGPPTPLVDISTSTVLTFDNNVNPFYGVFLIPAPGVFRSGGGTAPSPIYTYYGGMDNFLNLSQNNVLSAVTSGGATTVTTVYGYTYNAANLPTSRTTTTDGVVVETLRLEYENY